MTNENGSNPMMNIVNVVMLFFIGVLIFDNYMLRTKLDVVNMAVEEAESRFLDLDDKINLINLGLAKNLQEDSEFREQQTKFDSNVMNVFMRNGLILKEE